MIWRGLVESHNDDDDNDNDDGNDDDNDDDYDNLTFMESLDMRVLFDLERVN